VSAADSNYGFDEAVDRADSTVYENQAGNAESNILLYKHSGRGGQCESEA